MIKINFLLKIYFKIINFKIKITFYIKKTHVKLKTIINCTFSNSRKQLILLIFVTNLKYCMVLKTKLKKKKC